VLLCRILNLFLAKRQFFQSADNHLQLSEKAKLFDSIKWPKLLKIKALKAVACRLNSVALIIFNKISKILRGYVLNIKINPKFGI
jgi:hypothetical protein